MFCRCTVAIAALTTAFGVVAFRSAKVHALMTSADRVFELRTYHASPGKLDALNARFRNHTNKLFVKHGMELIAYWVPAEGNAAQNTLIYVLAFPSKEARDKSFKEFGADPEWQRVKTETEKDGKLVEKVDSVIMRPTDYSPMK